MIPGRARQDADEGARPRHPAARRGHPRTRPTYPPRDRRDEVFTRRYREPAPDLDSPPVLSYHYSNSKFDSDAKSYHAYSLPEDPRISKLLRRLCGETDPEKALAICGKLRDAITLPENSRYVRRSHDSLAESLLNVLYDAPDLETKVRVADALGRIGYVMGPDYGRHLDWIVAKFASQRNEDVKRMLVQSLRDLFELDAENPSFEEHASATVKQLQEVIETTDSSKIFGVAVDAIVILADAYPDSFAEHFIDTVDILIGWHMDRTQSASVRRFALETLEKFGRHWRAEAVFSINLLGQFVDDMVSSGESAEAPPTDDTETKAAVGSIASYMNVFNAVTKSLGEVLSATDPKMTTRNFLSEWFGKILKTFSTALRNDVDRELIDSGNESVYLMLDRLHGSVSPHAPLLYETIELQLASRDQMDDGAVLSLLNVIRKIIKEISSNLSEKFIETTIGPSSPIPSLKSSPNKAIRETVVGVYRYLLNLKNIPRLQDAYRYVLEDIEEAHRKLVRDANASSYNTDAEAEYAILFDLQCLTDIANASNSIIGMWALRPSVLELLAVKLTPYNDRLCVDHPSVQYSIIYLLYSHCRKNNHFIASSDLVSFGRHRSNVHDLLCLSDVKLGETSTASPTCGHFAIIMTLFDKLFKCRLPTDTLILLLNWMFDIFSQLVKSYAAVFRSKYLIEVVLDCLDAGFSTNERIVKAVIKNLNIIMSNRHIQWNVHIMKRMGELCMMHIDNNDDNIRREFFTIFTVIPWDITLELIKTHYSKAEKYESVTAISLTIVNMKSAQKEHLMKDTFGQMSTGEFKSFMNYLLFVSNYRSGWLQESFLNCWPIKNLRTDNVHLEYFRQCALNFSSVLTMWATWEAAQLCTTLKLRTPLGKPQETFTSIESAIKRLARDFTSQDISLDSSKLKENNISKLKRSRILIEFFECLEKSMLNAIDGCAAVLLPMEKPVRTFFHTNSSTCQEWVSRVRPAAVLVSLHTGHAASAARHAQALLYIQSSDETPSLTSELLAHCVSLARAYLLLKEPEALIGLYAWVKEAYGKKLIWLKAAADQGAMRYETAATNYLIMMKNCTKENVESDKQGEESDLNNFHDCEKRFICDQIIECYKSIQFWSELINWKDEELKLYSKTDSFYSNESFADVACYNKFQENELLYLQDLCDWNVLTLDNDIKKGDNIIKMFDKTETTLKNIAFKIMLDQDYLGNATDTIENFVQFLQSSLHELSRNQPCELLTDINILHYAANGLKNIVTDGKLQFNPFFIYREKMSLKNTDPSILKKIIWWFDYFLHFTTPMETSMLMDKTRLDLVKASRKNGNIKLANRELLKYFNFSDHFQPFSDKHMKCLEDICDYFLRSINSFGINVWSPNNIVAVMETSKLLYVDENTKEMAMNLCASASLGVSQRLALGDHSDEFREKGTRMLLTLSKWVQNENDKLLTNNLNSPLTKLVTALPEIGLVNNNISAHVIPISDSAVGKLLQFSVNQCPIFAKAWFTFGSWCFRWGKKMVEFSSNTGGQLTENDKLQIQNVMIQGNAEEFETVCEILSKTRVIYDDEDIDWSEINSSDMIENQLRSVPCLRNTYPENLIILVDIWRQAQKRVFSYYELSADAYFKFLDLSSGIDNINHNGECAIVTATLRLLRLIVKHAMELQNVLETGLANTPTQPWKVIIPQLFSRLNHPENYVRRRVSELLCRLAEDTPHLITFPAVVGAVENKRNNLSDLNFSKSVLLGSSESELELDNVEENDIDEQNDDYLNSCFMDMVDTLSKQAPETILQVQLLVKELRRINLLWDELWLRTLAQHHSGISKRLVQLNSEINKVNTNSNLQPEEKEKLINEKHRIFMKPILFVLEQLADITRATPETPYEKSFQEKFLDSINEMLKKLKNPNQPDKPLEFWLPIKQLQTKLQQKANKRSPYTLKMSDISPVLANMQNTVISMPGVQTSSKVRITIMSIDNNVAILPSKTKPKKLIFHGCDGKTYTYLFKGLEDLHLDERIMQFLSITNIMMAQDKEVTSSQTYRARHYSVIPLGPRSGLISWVENLTPLFALYKRWQQRDAVSSSLKNNLNKPAVVLRPSELFYNKLLPLLNAAGVSTENRKEWPITILKQVLIELMAETPKDLLAKELWSSSVTPGQWWRTVRRYSFSVAVMSTIGYIIGLGDRHLDNVLIDLSTGEVVHIDYNVCFEDGKTLRVPEKVPFRMTPNLERCLGTTGVEGIFRMACEHVLKTMKRGRKTLLTLLEAFVYDPLVEWSGEAGGGATGTAAGGALVLPGRASALRTAAIERRCGLDLLAVRILEIRHNWIDNRDQMQKQIPLLHQYVATWIEQQQSLITAETQLQQYHRQLALIKELEALGTDLTEHQLYSSAQCYSSYKQMKDALEESAKNLFDLHEECGTKIDNYTRAFEIIKGPQLAQWIQELNFPIDHDGHLVFDLIREFLLNAGQSSMITQCEQSETELGQCARQQTLLIKNCIELLSQFAAMAQYFPSNFMEKHRIVLYRKWAAILLKTESLDDCTEVIAQIHSFRSPENATNPSIQQVMAFSYQLQTIFNETNLKLNKIYERLKPDGGSEALNRCEKNYLDAAAAMSNFISQGPAMEKAMECVLINALNKLNHRFLILESSAQSAGGCLVDLTSREGDWFFDDMSIISSLVSEFTSFIPLNHESSTLNDERIPRIFECLKATKSIFTDLKELNSKFQMIILPEAIKKIQSEEPSVIMMINALNSVVINTDYSLNELLSQLELRLRYVIMDMELPSDNTHSIAADLRARYRNLVEGNSDSGTNFVAGQETPGRMLLMGSDGLFTHLGARGAAILDTLATFNIPHVWKKVDHIIEANELAASLHNEQFRIILDDIFLIKRIQAITDFFNFCVQMSCAFKGIGPVVVFDDERLCKPIKRFMSDYIARHFLGVQSQCLAMAVCLLLQRFGLNINKEIEQRHIGVSWKVPLNDLCEICISTSIKNGQFTASLLQQASALSANLEGAFKRRETVHVLNEAMQFQRESVTRLKHLMTAHAWLRGEGRGMPGSPTPGVELRRAAQQLVSQRPHLAAALEKHRSLVASAEQRLKWASGANPALNEVMAAFECAVNIREDRLGVEHALAASVGATCGALGGLNIGGSNSGGGNNAWNGGRDLAALANRRRSALALVARAPHTPAPLHEALLQLLPPESNIDAQWVNKVSTIVSEKIMLLQKSITDMKTCLTSSEDVLKKAALNLNALKTTHENLIFDAKSLLKVISKTQENIGIKAFDYMAKHKSYINDLTELAESLNAISISEKNTIRSELISKLELETKSIYDEFLSFEAALKDVENSSIKRRGTLVRQLAGVWNSPARQIAPPKGRNQQANAYAVSVWKRVRLKLEGRDPDPARKHSNQEQVDYIIKEAMSLDNLCLLYEGWTPWV